MLRPDTELGVPILSWPGECGNSIGWIKLSLSLGMSAASRRRFNWPDRCERHCYVADLAVVIIVD